VSLDTARPGGPDDAPLSDGEWETLASLQANLDLGFKEDLRDYGIAAQMLRELGVSRVRLLTNNPRKIAGVQRYGIQVILRGLLVSSRTTTTSTICAPSARSSATC